ncbi:MAG: YceD family protein [Streptosporangiaceae bacterium]
MRSLGRQPGSARNRKLTAPAPADLRLELIGVPEGAAAELDLRFEAVAEGVLVTGTVTAPLAGECARCLGPVASSVTASFTELYLYPPARPRGTGQGRDGRHHQDRRDRYDEHEEQDDEERYLDGDLLDLEPALRDAVVLALPMSPLCRDDCPGLCIECGAPLGDAGLGHRHEDPQDPRWNALKQFDDQATPDQPRRAGAIDLQEG